MKNAQGNFSGDRLRAGRGSNYDTYRRSNLPDHQTTCLIRARTRGGIVCVCVRARAGASRIGLPQQSKSHPFVVPERVWISF